MGCLVIMCDIDRAVKRSIAQLLTEPEQRLQALLWTFSQGKGNKTLSFVDSAVAKQDAKPCTHNKTIINVDTPN